jgi:hypothetical protein
MLALFIFLFLLTAFMLLSAFMVTSPLFPFLTFMGYIMALALGFTFEKAWKDLFNVADKPGKIEMSVKDINFQVFSVDEKNNDVILGIVVDGNR